jgi:hypothetical protein
MENYEDYYLDLISPNTIIDSFKTDEEFESWCECRSYEYLTDLLKDFVLHERYEHCVVIRATINDLYLKKLLRN